MKRLNCILLIDDNPADNEFHEIAIRRAGICDQIKVALDGFEALNYIRQSAVDSANFPTPDLIFLDVNMPGMNGFEFLEEYQKLDEEIKSKLVIMMLTTSLNPDDELRAKTYTSLRGFMNKPLTTDTLLELIAENFEL